MTNGINKTILDIMPILIAAAIIGTFGMQIALLKSQADTNGEIRLINSEISHIKELNGVFYTKSEGTAAWKIQELKDTQQSERMNLIVNRLNVFEENFLKQLPK